MKKILRQALLPVALASAAMAAQAGDGYNYLYVDQVTQEHSQWCWAASSVDVLSWYGVNESQCAAVNWAYGINYACGNTTFDWNSPANSPNGLYGQSGSVQNVLGANGVPNQGYASALSWSAIVNDINANRPFVIRFGWYGGGGHILVGYGWDVYGGTEYVGYMNPWPGEGFTWSTYAWTVNAPYDHTWTHSLRMTR